jgi:hypothetical protein
MTSLQDSLNKISPQFSVKEVEHLLFDIAYPNWLNKLNQLMQDCTEQHLDNEELILQLIKTEFEILTAREQIDLFPLLQRFEENKEKSENCKPFKEIKKHYKSILSNFEILKKSIQIDLSNVIDKVNILQNQIIEIQQQKDKYFFVRFKNCSGCK